MKKSLLALAVLGAFAGVASAQSSVTLFGIVDLNARYVKNDGSNRRLSLSQDGINSSRLGFRGVEDLGGGLSGRFWLEAGLNPDNGSTNAQFFNRRSTVSLVGGFGEVRLGRDYSPTFWNTTIFDVFGTNGLGDSSGVKQITAADYVRANNTIAYFLPSNIGGVYGQFTVGAAEGAAAGRYIGGRLGFAAGPFDIAAAYATERVNTGGFSVTTVTGSPTTPAANAQSYKSANIGGSYDFGVVKLLGYYQQEKVLSFKDKIASISLNVPLGQGEIHAGYNQSKISGPINNKVSKAALGYVYNLSKRTALYSTAALVDNDNASRVSLGGVGTTTVGSGNSGSATAAPTAGGKSKGIEFGVRHIF
ncbi:MAG: porin [Rhizobiales bacterium]|nr:porin [Rhizobacter sp.]